MLDWEGWEKGAGPSKAHTSEMILSRDKPDFSKGPNLEDDKPSPNCVTTSNPSCIYNSLQDNRASSCSILPQFPLMPNDF